MTQRASGTFDVRITPHDNDADTVPNRLTLDKEFQGDLVGSSHGEMLAASTAVPGSAGYVAIERVSGSLHGRRGSFVLQHSGTMTRGAPHLNISVVPDSGTEQLSGLVGTMSIDIAAGKHHYRFEYSFAEQQEEKAAPQR